MITAILICLTMLTIVPMAGCPQDCNIFAPDDRPFGNRQNPVIEYGYFVVWWQPTRNTATVLELTELGKQQEILKIPIYVRGLPVQSIGFAESSRIYTISSVNLRKIYIPRTVSLIDGNFMPRAIGQTSYEKVFLLASPSPAWAIKLSMSTTISVVTQQVYDSVPYWRWYKERLRPPNVIYRYNFFSAPNLGYFWFDRITGYNLYMRPSNPTRANYAFKGWYLEPETINRWNGVHPANIHETIELFARWQAID